MAARRWATACTCERAKREAASGPSRERQSLVSIPARPTLRSIFTSGRSARL